MNIVDVSFGIINIFILTVIECFYVALSFIGMKMVPQSRRMKNSNIVIGATALLIFGVVCILSGIERNTLINTNDSQETSLLIKLFSGLVTAISNPERILFWIGFFMIRSTDKNYSDKELNTLGIAAMVTIPIFYGMCLFMIRRMKIIIPDFITSGVTKICGIGLASYGILRIIKSSKNIVHEDEDGA